MHIYNIVVVFFPQTTIYSVKKNDLYSLHNSFAVYMMASSYMHCMVLMIIVIIVMD